MKKLFKLYREKVLATPNLKGASLINLTLALLHICIIWGAIPAIMAGKIFAVVLAAFCGVCFIDSIVSACIQRKEMKRREKAEK